LRLGVLAIGIILLIAGLSFISVARTPTTITEKYPQIIKTGERDSTEITDIPINKGDKFIVTYSGGGQYISQEDIIVSVYDPFGNETHLSYMTERENGIIANYTGLYKVQLGAPGIIDPSRPLILTVQKIIEHTDVEYPNSNLLPLGYSMIFIGAGVTVLGAKISKRKTARSKSKKHKR